MTVVWALLAQRDFPATLLQTSEPHGVEEVNLPFNVFASFIPRREHGQLTDIIAASGGGSEIIHQGEPMQSLLDKATLAALHNVPALLLGESGTGKELLAAWIHRASNRRGKFIAVNCGAIAPTLAETEFFGSKRGGFTGAEDAPGKFEEANKGTIFLDEIGDLPPDLQVKVLRVLQEGKVVRVGSNEEIEVDVRVIAATHRDLMKDVATHAFREDLFYRLAVVVLSIPPLRERGGDAALIADYLLVRINDAAAKVPGYLCKKLDNSAKDFINSHRWQGNIRELNNMLRRACIWNYDAVLSKSHIEKELIDIPNDAWRDDLLGQPFDEDFQLDELVGRLKDHYLEKAFEKTGGNQSKMAELLGISRPTVAGWMEKAGRKK